MKIQEISIRNFKSFGDKPEVIPINENITVFVGANSSGKTNILKALDLFFNYSKSQVQKDIFHNKDVSKPIEITIVFSGLSNEEKRIYRSNLTHGGLLYIRQRIWAPLPETENENTDQLTDDVLEKALENVSQEKRGIRVIAVPQVIEWLNCEGLPTQEQVNNWWQQGMIVGDTDFKLESGYEAPPSPEKFKEIVDNVWNEHNEEIPQIDWLNISPNKTKVRAWWRNNLIIGGADLKAYFDDPNAIPEPENFLVVVEQFWHEHSEKILTMRHETSEKMLGWLNKLKGNLPELVYIPAIRHLHEEMRVAKTNPFGSLLNWLAVCRRAIRFPNFGLFYEL